MVKAQHEGALPPPCIVRKDPRLEEPWQHHKGCVFRFLARERRGGQEDAAWGCAVIIPTLRPQFLKNPMDGGAWWAAVHGVAKSQTRLKELSKQYI